MILLQLSAGQGPDECARAVALALGKIQQDCHRAGVRLDIVESQPGQQKRCYQSLILSLEGDASLSVAERWSGNLLWICQSPFRIGHKRKNWFFSGQRIDAGLEASELNEKDIIFTTCRASGAGGQHVNKTNSAVRALHSPSGLNVRVETERSQHANKKLAIQLLAYKLAEQEKKGASVLNANRRMTHHQLERGNPVRIFKGERFKE
ncbi:peptide chain release factor H [Bacterioplanoides sp.]|uniref:peptide chain release factor H n=1 Tax=Bacterioplanoides sp. TaxID=2066072 RepID=UPI003B001EF3